jgi:hypothetical protein
MNSDQQNLLRLLHKDQSSCFYRAQRQAEDGSLDWAEQMARLRLARDGQFTLTASRWGIGQTRCSSP